MAGLRCWKMFVLNNPEDREDLNELRAEIGENLRTQLITRMEGLLAGGSTSDDVMPCPKDNEKSDPICKNCTFSGPMDSYSV